ncbi:MAG: hypothetical protein KJO19_07865, partial [Woeseia sp.]|nr:hypothetical protein [Woeseia sp.]
IPWLASFAKQWLEQQSQGRRPHAVLLLGAPGVGKRCAAAWLARRQLRPDAAATLPQFPPVALLHPDLHWLRKPDDKQTIIISQVRELIGELALTSHEGRGKVAVIEPANIMTHQAANSLLKTLEEPPGDALIILIADRMGRLPATILSRCQRVTLAIPDEATSLAWLERQHPGSPWAEALREAGGAPLAALEVVERLADTEAMGRDLRALADRSASPVDVAARWLKQYPDLALEWLGRQVTACIRRQSAGAAGAPAAILDDSVLQRIDSRNLFCYLDIINRLRGQAGGSYNVQLTLEGLLIDWAEGLVHCRQPSQHGNLWPRAATR